MLEFPLFSSSQQGCAASHLARGHTAPTACQAPCACLGGQSCWECCFPADGKITAQAPVVRKGPGSCTKRQKRSLIQPSHAGIIARSCLFKQRQPTLIAPLSLSLNTNSSLDLLEAVLCVKSVGSGRQRPQGFSR